MTEITMTRAPSSKSVVRSLRLDEDVDKSLHKLASDEGISINSLVNRALRRYVVWDVNSSRFGGVTLAGASLTRIMNYLSDDEVREYAQWVADNSVRDFLLLRGGHPSYTPERAETSGGLRRPLRVRG